MIYTESENQMQMCTQIYCLVYVPPIMIKGMQILLLLKHVRMSHVSLYKEEKTPERLRFQYFQKNASAMNFGMIFITQCFL